MKETKLNSQNVDKKWTFKAFFTDFYSCKLRLSDIKTVKKLFNGNDELINVCETQVTRRVFLFTRPPWSSVLKAFLDEGNYIKLRKHWSEIS